MPIAWHTTRETRKSLPNRVGEGPDFTASGAAFVANRCRSRQVDEVCQAPREAPRAYGAALSGCPAWVLGDSTCGLRSRRFQVRILSGILGPPLSATCGTVHVSARRITIYGTQLPPTSRLALTAYPLAELPVPAKRPCKSQQIAAKSCILSRTTQDTTATQITKRNSSWKIRSWKRSGRSRLATTRVCAGGCLRASRSNAGWWPESSTQTKTTS